MTTLNAYATLAEYKAYAVARGQTSTTEVIDDGVVERLLKAASRYMTNESGRRFDPRIETRYYDIPDNESVDPRELKLDADLLEVLTLTNGDGTVIPSTAFTLRPRNQSPYRYIRLKDTSLYGWTASTSAGTHDVIEVYGLWGHHNRYAEAWQTITTAAEALDAVELSYDVTLATDFAIGNLIRFDDELGYISGISSNTLTITRGENGSTAATHLTAINVKAWQVMDEVKQAVLAITLQAYKQRFGQSISQSATVTAAGVVLSPRDIPAFAQDTITGFRLHT